MQPLTTRVFIRAVLVVAAVLAFTWPFVIDPLALQTAQESTEWPPLTADGQPDMQGVWANAEIGTWTVWYERASYLETIGMPKLGGLIQSNSGPIAPPSMPIRETPLLDPPDAILPYQPWALERRNSVMKDYLNPAPWQMDTQTPGWPTGIVRGNKPTAVLTAATGARSRFFSPRDMWCSSSRRTMNSGSCR